MNNCIEKKYHDDWRNKYFTTFSAKNDLFPKSQREKRLHFKRVIDLTAGPAHRGAVAQLNGSPDL